LSKNDVRYYNIIYALSDNGHSSNVHKNSHKLPILIKYNSHMATYMYIPDTIVVFVTLKIHFFVHADHLRRTQKIILKTSLTS